MLRPMEKRLAHSILVLTPDQNFQVVLSWLKESLQETRVENDELSGEALTRNQGVAIALREIVREVENAADTLGKLIHGSSAKSAEHP